MNERVTVELDAEMLKRAQEAGLDLSRTLARALRRELPPLSDKERKRAADKFYAENKEEIDYYNDYVEKHGLFSDGMRTF
jgi:antitoxin CcdA